MKFLCVSDTTSIRVILHGCDNKPVCARISDNALGNPAKHEFVEAEDSDTQIGVERDGNASGLTQIYGGGGVKVVPFKVRPIVGV
jgi:hypothetical protein